MARYRKTTRRNKQTLKPHIPRRPGQPRVRDLRRLPWWHDPVVMNVDRKELKS
jgi:hypothetical protein